MTGDAYGQIQGGTPLGYFMATKIAHEDFIFHGAFPLNALWRGV
jgi:hypothetical protein